MIAHAFFISQLAIRLDTRRSAVPFERRVLAVRHDGGKKSNKEKGADESEFLHRISRVSAPEARVVKLNEPRLSERFEHAWRLESAAP